MHVHVWMEAWGIEFDGGWCEGVRLRKFYAYFKDESVVNGTGWSGDSADPTKHVVRVRKGRNSLDVCSHQVHELVA